VDSPSCHFNLHVFGPHNADAFHLNGGHIDIPQALCKSGEALFGTTWCIQLITRQLINPFQDHYGDLAVGFFLISLKNGIKRACASNRPLRA
jgi:hypothetical protein